MIKIPLNKYSVEMVRPKQCIRGLDSSLFKKDMPYEYCSDCDFRRQELCVYEEYVVQAAEGNIEPEEGERERYYIQWCCANCGEIIQLIDRSSYLYHHLVHDEHVCKHCKTVHIHIDNIDGVDHTYKFAVPVGKIGGKK